MNRLRTILLIITVAVSALSCGASNSLSGSVSEFDWWSLNFESVEARLYQEGLVINYLRSVSGSAEPDYVASVWVLTSGTSIVAGEDIDMASFGRVDRFVRVLDDNGALVVDNHPFPGIAAGKINFTSVAPEPGSDIAGKFYITFTNGYTLNGAFSSSLIVQE